MSIVVIRCWMKVVWRENNTEQYHLMFWLKMLEHLILQSKLHLNISNTVISNLNKEQINQLTILKINLTKTYPRMMNIKMTNRRITSTKITLCKWFKHHKVDKIDNNPLNKQEMICMELSRKDNQDSIKMIWIHNNMTKWRGV